MATYRFNPFTGLPDDAGVGGGPFQPLDGDLTAIAALVGTGIAVRSAADTWLLRSIGVTDTASVDLTITNGDGVAGNPTLSAAVIPGGIDHGALADLLADDHTQYLLLSGRPGATNDPVISSTASFGTITGSLVAGATLRMQGSTALLWTGSETEVMARLRVGQGIVGQIGGTELGFITVGEGAAYDVIDAGRISALDMMTTLNFVGNVASMRGIHIRSLVTNTAGITSTLSAYRAYNDIITFTPGTGSTIAHASHVGMSCAPIFSATGVGNTLTLLVAAQSNPNIGSTWTATDIVAARALNPGGTGGITRLGGWMVENLTRGTDNYSGWSKGSGPYLAHGGPAVFGADQTTLTAPTAGATIDAFGNILINNTGTAGELRLREPSAGGSSYTGFKAPALAGNIIYTLPTVDAAGGLVSDGAGVLSWDVDLGEIAALANVRGDLLVTNSTPAWVRLPIGSADRYLRSDGSDPAWAQVTELGLVDTYNGVTTVGNGVPSVIAEVNSTGQTADIASTSMFTTAATGWYRLAISVVCTTDGGAGDTMPGSSMSYTDGTDSAVKTVILTGTVANPNTTGLSSARSQTVSFYALTGTNINYATNGYVGGTGMQYAVRLRLERL